MNLLGKPVFRGRGAHQEDPALVDNKSVICGPGTLYDCLKGAKWIILAEVAPKLWASYTIYIFIGQNQHL